MNYFSDLEYLKLLIQTALPGEAAQQKMAPLGRPSSSLAMENAQNVKESGVAVLIYEEEPDHRLVLIQRPTYEGNHSGQVSFPGGKKEFQDEDLLATAIRECGEEIGVHPERSTYLGKLTPVFIPVSNFYVEPHIFFFPTKPEFKADEYEVSEIFSINVNDLLDERRIRQTNIRISEKMSLKDVPYFDLNDKVIWGATALILSELKEILRLVP